MLHLLEDIWRHYHIFIAFEKKDGMGHSTQLIFFFIRRTVNISGRDKPKSIGLSIASPFGFHYKKSITNVDDLSLLQL